MFMCSEIDNKLQPVYTKHIIRKSDDFSTFNRNSSKITQLKCYRRLQVSRY